MLTKSDIDWLKTELVPEIAEQVAKTLSTKFDKIYTLVDGFAGEVKTYREVQELTGKKLSDHEDRIDKLEHPQAHP